MTARVLLAPLAARAPVSLATFSVATARLPPGDIPVLHTDGLLADAPRQPAVLVDALAAAVDA